MGKFSALEYGFGWSSTRQRKKRLSLCDSGAGMDNMRGSTMLGIRYTRMWPSVLVHDGGFALRGIILRPLMPAFLLLFPCLCFLVAHHFRLDDVEDGCAVLPSVTVS